MLRPFRVLVALGAALGASIPATLASAEGFVVVDDVVQVTMLPGWRTASGSQMTALQIDLAPGWKTYWRSPGEGGIPPVFDWSKSMNVKGVMLHWPKPMVFDQLGLQSIGYKHQVILPMEFIPARPDAAITIDATVQIGVCEDICLPVSRTIHADLPATGGAQNPAILAALADRPVTAAKAGLRAISCRISPIADGVQVTATLDLPGTPEAVVFETPDNNLWISQSKLASTGGRLTATADFVPVEARPFLLDRSALRLTVIDKDKTIDIQGCPAP